MPDLKDIAKSIWGTLGENDRANAATTIAVVKCTNEELYCTSNDVSKISEEAIIEAKKNGISTIKDEYISQAGGGFHAEMWAVIQAIHGGDQVSDVLSKIGASRPCCKNCSDVLKVLEVEAEETSEDEYQSWYNPITLNEEDKPRDNFTENQYKHIPDFRNHGKNYWLVINEGKEKWIEEPPVSAK